MKFLELLNKANLIAAHRGARSIAPENTLLALGKSIGKCDFIEIDVQLSKDGRLIVMHDETLERTTNVSQIASFLSRKPYNVSDFTLDELRGLDYGSWFYKDKKRQEPLLTLNGALKFIKENNMLLNIEIKDMSSKFGDKEVVGAVTREIKESGTMDSVLISSFRHEYLKIIKGKLPDVPTAALVEGKHPPKLLEYLRELKVDGYSLNNELVDKQSVEMLREAGYFVGVYTVNDAKRAKELFGMSVNCIFSDSLEKKEVRGI